MSNIELLKGNKIFQELTDEELKMIDSGLIEQDVQMGTVIIEENDIPREVLFIVKDGEIAISTGKPDKQEGYLLTTMGPGEAFGEISLIDDSPHSATVRALTDAKILCLSSGFFNNLVDKDRNIGYIIMRNLARLICERLRSANFTIKHFGYFGKLDDE